MFKTFTREGTIKAATQKLSHVAGLGIDIIYLAPFCEMDTDGDRSAWSERQIKSGMNNPKNPYRIADYFKIDEEYGSESDLKDFMDEAHGLGMKVVFDLVYMHCGPTKFVKDHPTYVKRNENGSILCYQILALHSLKSGESTDHKSILHANKGLHGTTALGDTYEVTHLTIPLLFTRGYAESSISIFTPSNFPMQLGISKSTKSRG